MKTKLYKLTRWLCTLLLGVLGFTSCEKEDEIGDTPAAYGTPTADYIFEGVVTDQAGNPIKGIEVQIDGSFERGTLRTLKHETAADGTYFTNIYKECGFVRSITYTDVDGEENGGEFESLTIKPDDMEKLKLRDGEGWYGGVFKLSAEVKLKNKE
jgi:putative lipoprotein (rSAM/lipoprotein system)